MIIKICDDFLVAKCFVLVKYPSDLLKNNINNTVI